jgi:hypothetical protein
MFLVPGTTTQAALKEGAMQLRPFPQQRYRWANSTYNSAILQKNSKGYWKNFLLPPTKMLKIQAISTNLQAILAFLNF